MKTEQHADLTPDEYARLTEPMPRSPEGGTNFKRWEQAQIDRLKEAGNMLAGEWTLAEMIDAYMLEHMANKRVQIILEHKPGGRCWAKIVQYGELEEPDIPIATANATTPSKTLDAVILEAHRREEE
jgi:hypothetical protein